MAQPSDFSNEESTTVQYSHAIHQLNHSTDNTTEIAIKIMPHQSWWLSVDVEALIIVHLSTKSYLSIHQILYTTFWLTLSSRNSCIPADVFLPIIWWKIGRLFTKNSWGTNFVLHSGRNSIHAVAGCDSIILLTSKLLPWHLESLVRRSYRRQ